MISSMRHDEAPSTKVSPGRLSNTISSSSSPTRAAPGPAPRRKTPNRPRSGMVPPLAIATRLAPSRATRVPALRSSSRGRSSATRQMDTGPTACRHSSKERAAQFRERPARRSTANDLYLPFLHGSRRDDLLRRISSGLRGTGRLDGSLGHGLATRRTRRGRRETSGR